LDFGWDHPTAATRLAIDTENDVYHLVSAYRQSKQTPVIHASAIKKWGDWIPVAWPKDGLQTDKGSGLQLAEIYRGEGLKMLSEYAQFPDKRGNGVEAGLIEMQQRMDDGRFKVDKNLHQWREEYQMYHRIEGKINAVNEDLICSTRYAVMMARYAQSAQLFASMQRDRWRKKRPRGTTWMAS
jgi:hypothetical protein